MSSLPTNETGEVRSATVKLNAGEFSMEVTVVEIGRAHV